MSNHSPIRWPLIIILVLLLYTGLFAKRGWFDWQRMERQNDQIRAKIELAQIKNSNLDYKINALKNDKREQERMVREVLGYIREQETVVEFP